MKTVVHIGQIIISVLLIVCILLQSRGVGLGTAWGGGGNFYSSKRGVEKILFRITVILATIFLLTSMLSAII